MATASGAKYVGSWNDIEEVAAGDQHFIGLKSAGTVVAAGSNLNGECNVGSWGNIVRVAGEMDTPSG